MRLHFSKGALLCLLLTTLLFAACKKDDDTDKCGTSGTFTCKLNGQTFTAASFNNTLFKGTDNANGGAAAKRFDIRAIASNGAQIILSLSDFRDGTVGNDFRLGKYYVLYNQSQYGYCGNSAEGVYSCVGGIATYYPTTSFTNFYMSYPGNNYDNDSTHYIMITENNESAGTISGNFKVATFDIMGDEEFLFTEGEFKNLCYRVIEQ